MTKLRGNPGSPNYCWAKAGYQIKREPRKKSRGFIRHIFAPDGTHVMSDGSHEDEIAEICRRGIYQE